MSETEAVSASEPEKPVDTTDADDSRAERLAKQEETDSRSVYVGNVDFNATPEQLENFFNAAGVIERITILFDKYTGAPKGYAYIEFDSVAAAQKAIDDFNGQDFRSRKLKVTNKRTNLPRMSKTAFRGRGRGRGRARGRGRGRGSFRGRGGGDFADDGPSSVPDSQPEAV